MMHKTERTAVRKDMFGAARAAVFMAVCVAHGALSAGAADYYNVPSPTSYEGYGSSSISGAGSSTGWSDTPGGSRTLAGITVANSVYHVWTDTLCRSAPGGCTTPPSSFIEVEEGVSWSILGKQSGSTTTLNNVLLKRGSTLHYTNNGDGGVGTLAGSFAIADGATLAVTGRYLQNARGMRLTASVSGTGSLAFYRHDGDNTYQANPVTHTVSGDLSRFTGDFVAYDHEDINTLVVDLATQQSLPGDPAADATAKVVVTNGVTLKINFDWTSPLNRSWDFGAGSRPTVYVAAGKTVTIRGHVSGANGFIKTGGGTLVLAGWLAGFGENDIVVSEGEVIVNLADGEDDALRIMSVGEEVGSPSPAYGVTNGLAAGASIPVSAPAWTNAAETVAVVCTGWRLRDGTGEIISSGTGGAFTYVHPDPAAYRSLEWLWTHMYRAEALASADDGAAAVSAPWVAEGAAATFTATPAEGRAFSCWMNGATVVSRENPYTLAVEGPTTLRAVFTDTAAHGWLYDTAAKTLTEQGVAEGDVAWVLNCAVSGQNLTLASVKTAGTSSNLNFRTALAASNGGTFMITALGNSVFKNRNNILTLRLPDTLTSIGTETVYNCRYLTQVQLSANLKTIGNNAFQNCVRLRSVAPFLPATVTSVGGSAFYGCIRLASPLSVGHGRNDQGEPLQTALGTHAFYQNKIPSVRLGDGISSIPDCCFYQCPDLPAVRLPAGIRSIGAQAFYACASLTEVTPLLPTNCTSVGGSAFNGAPVAGELHFATNGAAATLGGEWNFAGTRLTRVVLGDAVTAIPNSCFRSIPTLESARLPANLKSIGNEAFRYCPLLADVSPLLPANCTSVGSCAFNALPIAGELHFATNGATASFGGDSNFAGTRLTRAVLGDNIAAIPANCFRSITTLASVRLPANLKSIGNEAFRYCPLLSDVSPLLPATCTSVGESAFNAVPVAGELHFATNGATASFVGSWNFAATRLSSASFGAGIAKLPSNILRGIPTLRRVVFASKPTIDNNAFYGIAAYQARLVVPASNADWTTFVNTDSSATRWEDLTDAVKQRYLDDFPGEPTPRALGKAPVANQWIVSYGPVNPADKDLVVAGTPGLCGAAEVSPAYGTYTNLAATAALPLTLTAPQYARDADRLSVCAGYRIETGAATGWTDAEDFPLADASAPSATYAPADGGMKRFSWIWEAVGWQVVVDGTNGAPGAVTVSGANLDGYFSPGATATVTAVPGPGATFGRWHGDVPAGHETDATLTLVMDGPKTLMPEFASEWVLADNGKTMTDGYWTINVSGNRNDGFVVGAPVTAPGHGILDLRKPIRGGGFFTAVGWHAFESNKAIKELRLPDTLRSFSERAFYGCTALTTITPFLPDSCTSIGNECFNGCAALTGDLCFATNGVAAAFGGSNHFLATKITSATLGEGVTAIPGGCFQNCASLRRVEMGEGVTSIGANAFSGSPALETVEPFLPAACTYLGDNVFQNCTSLTGDLFYATNGAAATFKNFNHFQATKITSATLGEGVTAVAGSCFQNCASLRRVKMGEGVTTIGGNAFNTCSALETVEPLLPTALGYLGENLFHSCGALTGTVKLGYGRKTVAFQNYNHFYKTSVTNAVFGPDITTLPPSFLQEAKKLQSITFDKCAATVNGYAFKSCTGVRDVWFIGEAVPAFSASAFSDWSAGQCVLHVPKGSAAWQAWIAENVTPWADLTDDLRDSYWDKWPNGRKPIGRTTASALPANQWVVGWTPPGTGLIILLR